MGENAAAKAKMPAKVAVFQVLRKFEKRVVIVCLLKFNTRMLSGQLVK
jgi:hypothetical protein